MTPSLHLLSARPINRAVHDAIWLHIVECQPLDSNGVYEAWCYASVLAKTENCFRAKPNIAVKCSKPRTKHNPKCLPRKCLTPITIGTRTLHDAPAHSSGKSNFRPQSTLHIISENVIEKVTELGRQQGGPWNGTSPAGPGVEPLRGSGGQGLQKMKQLEK